MTLVLLIGAGLLIHSFVRLTSVSPGFESSGRDGIVQIVKVTLPERLYDAPDRIHAFARGVLDRIQYMPGVTSASLINSVPFGMMFIQGDFEIEGQPKPTLYVGTPKIDGKYHIWPMDVIDPEEYDKSPDAVRAITQRFTTGLERLIRLAPEQYFWVHRRWKGVAPQ